MSSASEQKFLKKFKSALRFFKLKIYPGHLLENNVEWPGRVEMISRQGLGTNWPSPTPSTPQELGRFHDFSRVKRILWYDIGEKKRYGNLKASWKHNFTIYIFNFTFFRLHTLGSKNFCSLWHEFHNVTPSILFFFFHLKFSIHR